MDDLLRLTMTDAAEAVRSGRTTARALVDACLARIEATDGLVGSFASLQAEVAQQTAKELDANGQTGPLHGVPIALKDLFFTAGVATEANCRSLSGFTPDRDASVVSRLREAGAVIIGKTNTHELALGVSCPASRNPWNPGRMTGGSSGGNAAGLAALLGVPEPDIDRTAVLRRAGNRHGRLRAHPVQLLRNDRHQDHTRRGSPRRCASDLLDL